MIILGNESFFRLSSINDIINNPIKRSNPSFITTIILEIGASNGLTCTKYTQERTSTRRNAPT